MIDKFRNFSQTIYVKLLIILIIASFAFFGIGDIFKRNLSDHAIKIGSKKISTEYVNHISNILKNRYEKYKIEQPNEKTLQEEAIKSIIKENISLMEAEKLGINISNNLSFELIKNEANFQNINGEFAPEKFQQFLAINNLTEKQIFDDLKKQISINLFNNILSINNISFPNYQKLNIASFYEIRNATIIELKITEDIDKKQPTDAELVDFYDKKKNQFKKDESREINLIDLSCKKFENIVNINDKDINEEYNKNISNYQKSEERDIQQIISTSEKEINLAYKDLQSGKSFQEVAENLNINEKDLNLGYQNQKQIFKDFIEPIFSLKISEYSKPVKGPFAFHIFKVNNIIKAETKELEIVKNDIKVKLIKQKSCEYSENIYKKINENSSNNINEIAKENNLKLEILSIEKNNSDLNPKLIEDIFLNKKQNQITHKLIDDQNLFIYEIKKINTARILTLDEIKGTLIKQWQEINNREKFQQLAKTIHEEIIASDKSLKNINKLKIKYNILVSNESFKRIDNKYSPEVINNIYSLKISEISEPILNTKNNSFIIAILKNKDTEKIPEEQREMLNNSLNKIYNEHLNYSIENAYFNHLIKKYKVEIKSKNDFN